MRTSVSRVLLMPWVSSIVGASPPPSVAPFTKMKTDVKSINFAELRAQSCEQQVTLKRALYRRQNAIVVHRLLSVVSIGGQVSSLVRASYCYFLLVVA